MSTRFDSYNPEADQIFRVDGPMDSKESLPQRNTGEFYGSHPQGTKAAYTGIGCTCVYFAPKEFCSMVMQPYTDQEVFDFIVKTAGFVTATQKQWLGYNLGLNEKPVKVEV